MSAAGENDQSKEFEPSQRKLEEAQRRGDIARSTELSSALALLGLVLTIHFFGSTIVDRLGRNLQRQLQGAAEVSLQYPRGPLGGFDGMISALLPLFLVPAALVLGLLLATKGVIFSGQKIQPDLQRLNWIKTAKQKFGPHGWVEFFKSVTKLIVAVALVTFFLMQSIDAIAATALMDIRLGLSVTFDRVKSFLFFAVTLFLAIGLADFLWQILRHRSKLRMSRQELKDETRESEGDADLKQRRRQKGYDIATNRMLSDVPTAQVVIVNPTHYAVALRWDSASGRAPVCVAKGVENVAFMIREAAQKSGVPIHHDPPTARALYATIEIGHEVHPDHYRAVAAAIRFAEGIRKKASTI